MNASLPEDPLYGFFLDINVKASHIASGVCSIGVFANLCVLVSVFRHRKELLSTENNIAAIVILMIVASVLNGVYMVVVDELWVYDAFHTVKVLHDPITADCLSCLGYLLLTILFTGNLLLSMERHCLVRWKQRLSWVWILGVAACCGIPFWCMFITSFIIYDGLVSWDFLPLGIPVTGNETEGYLMASCLLLESPFFPLISLAICVVYENTYFLIADIYDDPEARWSENRALNTRTRLHRSVLLRCIFMSVFQLSLYAPSIVMMYLSIWNPNFFQLSLRTTWLLFAASVIPAFDPLLTLSVILLFQQEFRQVFFSDIRSLVDKIYKKKEEEVMEKNFEHENGLS
ncbi:hypothetical protein BDR26DRAFT_858780 [Obelidium mucronatum]|nr:hypothetical protein BDR26DRAFT_858780 [Obelidium mucronatum]